MAEPLNDKQNGTTRKVLWVALATIIVLVLAWHFLAAVLGIAIVIGAGAWAAIIGTVVFLSVAVLLFFLFSGVGILILSLLAFLWVLFAIMAFPFLFPLFAPLLIIVLFIAYVRRSKA